MTDSAHRTSFITALKGLVEENNITFKEIQHPIDDDEEWMESVLVGLKKTIEAKAGRYELTWYFYSFRGGFDYDGNSVCVCLELKPGDLCEDTWAYLHGTYCLTG